MAERVPIIPVHRGVAGYKGPVETFDPSAEPEPQTAGPPWQADGYTPAASLLPDPGNVWEAETAVVEGYRIAVDDGVFEVTVEGSTDTSEPTWTLIGDDITDGTANWVFIGPVGALPIAYVSDFVNAMIETAVGEFIADALATIAETVVDPEVVGQFWNDTGTVKVSAG